MKKWLLILFALILAVVCLAGCSKNESSPQTDQKAETGSGKESKDTQAAGTVVKGGKIAFGHYDQFNDTEEGPEPIEWIVLDVQGNKALLLSRYGLAVKPYNTEKTDITWENCSLRTWLNNEFLQAAFSEAEQSSILLTDVDNSAAQQRSESSTSGGNNTQDRIFLLSYHEAFDLYFTNDDSRKCAPTDYAYADNAWTDGSVYDEDDRTVGRWWLRSPGEQQNQAVMITAYGRYGLYSVNNEENLVRPAVWVNLESGIF